MNKITVIAFCAGIASSFIGGTLGIITSSPYTQDRTERVFVYDTLANDTTRAYACLCLTETYRANANGYVKGVRTLIPSPNGTVKGHVIEVSETELARLDDYWNVPETYTRDRITIGAREPVWVYIKK